MTTEHSHLLSVSEKQHSVNISLESGEAKSIGQVLADIRAGRVHVGPVLIYTLIAVIGSISFGLVIGYSSLTEYSLNTDTRHNLKDSLRKIHVSMGFTVKDDYYSYIAVSQVKLLACNEESESVQPFPLNYYCDK